MQKLTKEQATQILAAKSRNVILHSGSWKGLKVTNVTQYHRVNESGPDTVAIVNLQATTPYYQQKALELMVQGEYDAAANQGLSINRRENDWIPMKGQRVELIVDDGVTKDGEEALFTSDIIKQEAKAPAVVDFATLLARAEGGNVEGRAEVVLEEDKEIVSSERVDA